MEELVHNLKCGLLRARLGLIHASFVASGSEYPSCRLDSSGSIDDSVENTDLVLITAEAITICVKLF